MMRWNEFRSHIRHLSTEDQARVEQAFELGKVSHKDQKRKSGDPYFTHPIAVAHMLADMGADPDTLIAALLHDTIEDTNLTLKEIDAQFNSDVAMLIDGVTKLKSKYIDDNVTLEEEIETLRKIFTQMEKDVRIMIIKLVDRLHNMQTIEYMSPERQLTYAQETMEVFVKIADRLSMQDLRDEMEGLCLQTLEPELFTQLSELRKANEKKVIGIIQKIHEVFSVTHPNQWGDIKMLYEPKIWDKVKLQLQAGGSAITGLSEYTIVFICKDIPSCYLVLGMLHQQWQRETLSFQDFINSPQINGYQAIHTTMIMEDGTRIRCKIRTEGMHEYHHMGIASLCFDNTSMGLQNYLPWAGRISSLSEDTAEHSGEFWESLKSDILGDSIIVHGAGDLAILIPKDATALDGAFYCFGDKALNILTITVNGKKVGFNTQLRNAESIRAEFNKDETVDRSWLNFVNTGLATATIRKALSNQSDTTKYSIGKEIFQEVMTEKRRGFIEEFNQKKLEEKLIGTSYKSLQTIYEAIADGHLKPTDAYELLFGEIKRETKDMNKTQSLIKFSLDINDIDTVTHTIQLYKKFKINIRSLKFKPFAMMHGNITIKHPLTMDEQKALKKSLEAIGATNVYIGNASSKLWHSTGIAFLLVLWGFDPAVGYKLIHAYDIAALDLTIIRFLSLTCISAVLVLWKKAHDDLPEIRLPIIDRSLLITVFLLACIAFFTYEALQSTYPIHYSIPMTTGGVLLTSIVNKHRKNILLVTWGLLILGASIITLFSPSWSLKGMVYTLLAVVAFSAFSVVSEQYKRQQHVASRSAQYFLLLSILSAILTLPFLPFSTLNTYESYVIADMILFSIVFAGLPYYVYYYLLSYKQIDFVLRYSFLIIFSTMLGQVLIIPELAPISPLTLIAAVLVSIGAMLPMLFSKK